MHITETRCPQFRHNTQGEREHSGLRGGVHTFTGNRYPSSERGHIDHMPRSPSPHHHQSSPRSIHDAQHIDIENLLDHVIGLRCRVSRTQNPCAVDPDIRFDRDCEFTARIRRGHIEEDIGILDVRCDHVITLFAQSSREDATEATGSPGDDDSLHSSAVTPLPNTTTPPSLTV